jgi:glycine cleavage system H protein
METRVSTSVSRQSFFQFFDTRFRFVQYVTESTLTLSGSHSPDAPGAPRDLGSMKNPERITDMDVPEDRLYSEYHLWIKVEKSKAWIGITEYAKEELGEVDYVELPALQDITVRDRPFGILETSKAVTDLVAPISGVVIQTNTALLESPATLTDDPYGNGWLIVVKPSNPDEMDELIRPQIYSELIHSLLDE